jgi:hypothetical protein
MNEKQKIFKILKSAEEDEKANKGWNASGWRAKIEKEFGEE